MKLIAIITSDKDSSTTRVIEWIRNNKIPFIRINSGIDFLNNRFKIVETNELSIWYRKKITDWSINNLGTKDFENKRVDQHIRNELKSLMKYLFGNMYARRLCSDKHYNLNRLTTLSLAQKKGIETPRFKIVSQKKELLEFYNLYNSKSGVVIKNITNGIFLNISQKLLMSYTEKITEKDLERIPNEFFPSLIMENIAKQFDIRSFFIDGEFYSMAIFSQSDSKTFIDFRRYNFKRPNRTVPYQLPKKIIMKLKELFNHLNLNTGSVDMIKDTENRFVFLEINPYGQYDMVSKPCNYYLHKKIADYLCN